MSSKDIRDTIKRVETKIDSKNTEVKKVASESFNELGSYFKRFLEMVIKLDYDTLNQVLTFGKELSDKLPKYQLPTVAEKQSLMIDIEGIFVEAKRTINNIIEKEQAEFDDLFKMINSVNEANGKKHSCSSVPGEVGEHENQHSGLRSANMIYLPLRGRTASLGSLYSAQHDEFFDGSRQAYIYF